VKVLLLAHIAAVTALRSTIDNRGQDGEGEGLARPRWLRADAELTAPEAFAPQVSGWLTEISRIGLAILQARKPEVAQLFSRVWSPSSSPTRKMGEPTARTSRELLTTLLTEATKPKPTASAAAQIKPTTAISEVLTICCRFSSMVFG
jgi:hypothetical protein